jgi:hypothetical protein
LIRKIAERVAKAQKASKKLLVQEGLPDGAKQYG